MTYRTIRKLRKLIRDPKQYWEDSKVRKFLLDMSRKKNLPMDIPKAPITQTCIIKNEDLSKNTIEPKKSLQPQKISYVEEKQIKLDCVNFSKLNILTTYLKGTNLSKDNLLYLKQTELDELIEFRIKESNDVTQFKEKNYLSLDLIDNIDFGVSEESIFQALNLEQRSFFSNFKFILVTNPKSNFGYAIHTCSFKPRLSVVVTDKISVKHLNPLYIDDLYISEDLLAYIDSLDRFRNVKVISTDIEDIYGSIRNRFRETSTKDYNVFIPIKISDNRNENLIKNFEEFKDYDILISVEKENTRKTYARTFNEYIEQIKVKEIFIREELVLRYKSLLRKSLENDDFVNFLKCSLIDGYKFYEID